MQVNQSEIDAYRDYIEALIKQGTLQELQNAWNEAGKLDNLGLFARARINQEIFNIGDRLQLIDKRPSLDDLAKIAYKKDFFDSIRKGDPRSLFDYLAKRPSSRDIQLLVDVLRKGGIRNISHLAEIIYLLAMHTDTKQEALIKSVFENPLLYLVANDSNIPVADRIRESRYRLLNRLALLVKRLGSQRANKALKQIFTPVKAWVYIVRKLGYDPIERYESSMQEVEIKDVSEDDTDSSPPLSEPEEEEEEEEEESD